MPPTIHCRTIAGSFSFNGAPYRLRYIDASQLFVALENLELGPVIKRITEAADESSLFAAVQQRANAYNFDTFSIGLGEYKPDTPPTFYVYSPLPYDTWLEYHTHGTVQFDESIKHIGVSTLPTTWKLRESEITKIHPHIAELLKPYWALRVVWPIRGRVDQYGYLAFNTKNEHLLETDSSRFVSMLGEGQLLANYIYDQLVRLGVMNNEAFSPNHEALELSSKETELLFLASKGIETPEMSRLLEISQRTVNFHFSNILSKMGASNRAEAVARALHLNLINPQIMDHLDSKMTLDQSILAHIQS